MLREGFLGEGRGELVVKEQEVWQRGNLGT